MVTNQENCKCSDIEGWDVQSCCHACHNNQGDDPTSYFGLAVEEGFDGQIWEVCCNGLIKLVQLEKVDKGAL